MSPWQILEQVRVNLGQASLLNVTGYDAFLMDSMHVAIPDEENMPIEQLLAYYGAKRVKKLETIVKGFVYVNF